MDRQRVHSVVCAYAFLLLLAVCATGAEAVAPSPAGPQRILLLHSYHQGFQWTDDVDSAATRTLAEDLPGAEPYHEYLDSKRFINPALTAHFLQYLNQKYRNIRPSVVLVSDDAALAFLRKHRDELFPGVPVVYCGINDVAQTAGLPKDFGGIIEVLDIRDNLELARRLRPNLKTIAVITDGTPTGIGTRQEIIRASAGYPGLKFVYFNGEDLTTEALLERLRQLPDDAMAIAPAWYLDKSGKTFTNSESYPLICAASAVPVLATSAANLGLGVLGGKVNSGQTQGAYAAKVAARILTGTATPEDFSPHTRSENAYVFDDLVLRRFDISPSLLPPGSRIINRDDTLYERHTGLVWGVGIALLLLTGLTATLVLIVLRLRQARRRLALSEENLRITLHSIGDAVVTTDIAARITAMNPVAERLTGWSATEAIGRPLAEVYRIRDAIDHKEKGCPAVNVLKSGTVQTLQKRLVLTTRMDEEHYIADCCAPIRDTSGTVTGTVLVFHDCTEEFVYEEKLRHSQKMDAVGQLAGGIAHDFNNMLGGILGGAEILALSLPQESQLHKQVRLIISAAEQAAALTEKLLTFSRKGKILSTPVEIHAVIEDALVILERSLNRNIAVVREFGAGPTVIVGDPVQIQNALINLGLNAGHAMPGGGTLTFSTAIEELDATYCNNAAFPLTPGAYVKVNVRDTGTGIDPKLLTRIFEPFFTTKEVGKGTGLGLSAVYGTMKEHNGAVSVYSEPGEGSLFSLFFPISNQAITVEQTSRPLPHAEGGCILVVDDEPVIRTTAHHILQDLGYSVILATDGQEGLDIYRERGQQIDVVLLDMVMPRMGGLECFNELRKINPEVRAVICSGFAREGGLREIQQLGIRGFLKKPYRRSDLAHAISNAMRPID